MEVTPQIIKSVMKATYNLCDEDNYNVYDAYDTAEYLGLPLRWSRRPSPCCSMQA